MNLTLADQYYLKALGEYAYNMEFAIEHLQYALSYDEEHAQSLCLLGQIYMYQLKDYDEALHCFHRSMLSDPSYPDALKHMALLYLWLGQYDEVERLVLRGLKTPGMDHCTMLRIRAACYEYQGDYARAKFYLKRARETVVNMVCEHAIATDLNRVKAKLKRQKSQRKRRAVVTDSLYEVTIV